MRYPFTSIMAGLAGWGIILLLLSAMLLKKPPLATVPITIDAQMINVVKTPAPPPAKAVKRVISIEAKPSVKALKSLPVLADMPHRQPKPAPAHPAHIISEDNNALATHQPLPSIPDELREEAMNSTALARFHIAADGSATVELLQPSQNPKLNRLLLASLKTWQFQPARKQGSPIESVQNIRVHFKVE
jgi:protein TonB